MSAYPDGFAAWSEPQRNAFFASEAKAYDERRREADALGEPRPYRSAHQSQKLGLIQLMRSARLPARRTP